MFYNKDYLSNLQVTVINILAGFGITNPIGKYILEVSNDVTRATLYLDQRSAYLCRWDSDTGIWIKTTAVSKHKYATSAMVRVRKHLSNGDYSKVSFDFIANLFNEYYWDELGVAYV